MGSKTLTASGNRYIHNELYNIIIITLTPAKKELYNFYSKFGFIKTKIHTDSMIRYPT